MRQGEKEIEYTKKLKSDSIVNSQHDVRSIELTKRCIDIIMNEIIFS